MGDFGSNVNSSLSSNLNGFLGGAARTLVADTENFVPAGLASSAAGNPLAIPSGGQGAEAVNWAMTQMGVTEGATMDIVKSYS